MCERMLDAADFAAIVDLAETLAIDSTHGCLARLSLAVQRIQQIPTLICRSTILSACY